MAAAVKDNQQALLAVTQSSNQLASSLFQAVAEENPDNLIMSPLSVSVALAMAAYGARGETEKQFKEVLRLPSSDSVGIAGYQALIDNINNVKENKLLLANKLFVAEKFGVKPSYKDLTQTYFRSAAKLVNFAKSQEAASIVNTWVQQNTNDRIKELVTPADLNEMTGMVLVNAVYFMGQWKNKFNPALTKDIPFHVNENKKIYVPAMFRQGSYNYRELPELNARMVEIPYEGNELSMIIILPNEINGLAAVEQKLQNMSMTDILNRGYKNIRLYLPKFKVESKIELNSVLKKLGLTNMFSDQANFSGITDANLAVTKVVQKAFIEVNEEGTEAAAATRFGFAAASPVMPPTVFVDRPFIYNIIKKGDVYLPLFQGHVMEPQ